MLLNESNAVTNHSIMHYGVRFFAVSIEPVALLGFWCWGFRSWVIQWTWSLYTKFYPGRKQAYFRDFLVGGIFDAGEFDEFNHFT
uniref:Uncharacterized protein n=1 Tax=Romanomermis culicivorax TaxID=13658 RepID=A0A915JCB3_ROMCU